MSLLREDGILSTVKVLRSSPVSVHRFQSLLDLTMTAFENKGISADALEKNKISLPDDALSGALPVNTSNNDAKNNAGKNNNNNNNSNDDNSNNDNNFSNQAADNDDVAMSDRANTESMNILFGLYSILSSAIKHRLDTSTLGKELNAINMPKEYTSEIISQYNQRRSTLQASADSPFNRVSLPTIIDTDWRIDVAISTTTLSRVFKPSVLMSLTLSNGNIKTFECSVKKFHELRYNTAQILKHMLDLQNHPTLNRLK